MTGPLLDRRAAAAALAAAALAALGSGSKSAFAEASGGPEAWLRYDARLRGLLRTPPGEGFQHAVEAGLLEGTNRFRRADGLSALQPHEGLERAARAAAADMAARRFFDHRSPEGHDPSERVGLLARDLCGVSGENIAFQEGGAAPTARSLFEQWRDSPGHRENMLRPAYTHAGHGVIRIGDRTYAVAALAAERVRLGVEVPLRLPSGHALEQALAEATPSFDRFQLSAPDGSGVSPVTRLAEERPLPPGAWRLRPLLAESPHHFVVLWGPIFVGT